LVVALNAVSVGQGAGKMANMANLELLNEYCSQHGCTLKDICRELLIEKCDPVRKIMSYRHPTEVQNIIEKAVNYIILTTNGILLSLMVSF
jgi:hypothetical protein